MTFDGPLWLIGLVPWVGLALYLLLGRRRQEAVPFLDLWVGPVAGTKARPRLVPPPAAVVLALLAVVLALFGAARPWVALGGGRGGRVTVVVDRGATMSARGRAAPRYVEAAEALAEELSRA